MSSCIGDNYAIVKHFVEHGCDINSGYDSNTLLIMIMHINIDMNL